jgi:hypothetical protein
MLLAIRHFRQIRVWTKIIVPHMHFITRSLSSLILAKSIFPLLTFIRHADKIDRHNSVDAAEVYRQHDALVTSVLARQQR